MFLISGFKKVGQRLLKEIEIFSGVEDNGKKGKQNELVGKIILADFLEYTLEKFINFIREVEGLSLYKKLVWEGIIIRKYLQFSIVNRQSASAPFRDGVIAKIKKI